MRIDIVEALTEQYPGSSFNQLTVSIGHSMIIWAFTLFILVNIVYSFIDSNCEEQKRIYISCEPLTRRFPDVKPSMVLLGSSLMRKPFWLADRLHTDFVPDYDRYCQNFTLQNILRRAGFKYDVVSNFAIDEAMVSDVFLINKKLFENGNYPEWIIYGIAPRDFIDNLLSEEKKTPIFNSLYTFADIWSRRNSFVGNLKEKINFTFEKLFFLFDKRKQAQNALAKLFFDLLYKKPLVKGTLYEPSNGLSQLSELGQNADLWNISIEEYKRRYKTFDDKQLLKQQLFLKHLCQNSINNDSKILLINMPLTRENLALMPDGAYAKYRNAIEAVKQFKGVYLLDLQDHKDFNRALYRDSAHLNEKGAHLLSMIISDTLRTITNSQITRFKFPLDISKQPKTIDGIASWWLAKAYFANSTPPDIVLLGSSQLGPLLGADAYVYRKQMDVTGDHRSQVLEHDFYGLLNKKWKVFIGALPNAMISDQFIMSRTLFSTEPKPKLVVLTFSPRDFIDSYYNEPTKTEAYAFFSKYVNSNDSSNLLNAVRNNCALYNDPQNADYKYLAGVSPLTLGKPYERLCPGELTINSIDGCVVLDNTEEYKSRYKSPFSPQLDMQMRYFDSLLKYLAQQHIPVLAINLPLRKDNKQLLPDKFWKYYDNRISEICRINQADYVRVDQVVLPFKDNEFIDGVHLNSIGGDRLSKTIALFAANRFRLKTFQELLARDKYLQ